MAMAPKIEEPAMDNSVPYPEAPEVDQNDPNQECYRGSRNPMLSNVRQPSYRRTPFTPRDE